MAAQQKILAVSHACIRAANREMYRILHRQGVDIELLIPEELVAPSGKLLAEPQSPLDPVTHLQKMEGSNTRSFRFSGFGDLLKKVSPSIVFVESDPASLLTLHAGLWCKKNNAKLICFTNENLSWGWLEVIKRVGPREIPINFAKSLCHTLSRQLVDHVFTTSEEAKQIFLSAGYSSVSVIPLGTDRKIFKYSSAQRHKTRKQLGIDEASGPLIAYFGRLVPEKGIETLVEALGTLRDHPWQLLLNRFESQSAYAERIMALINEFGIAPRLHILETRHGVIAEAMTATDVVVLPSRSTPKWVEQFGRVVPEAMACGNLVIVSDSGAPKELVGASGLVFREGDVAQLAAILRDFMAKPAECLTRRQRAIRHVHRSLSIVVQAKAMSEVFSSFGQASCEF